MASPLALTLIVNLDIELRNTYIQHLAHCGYPNRTNYLHVDVKSISILLIQIRKFKNQTQDLKKHVIVLFMGVDRKSLT